MKFVKSILSILSVALLVASFTGCKSDKQKCAEGDRSACEKVANDLLKSL